MRLPFCHPRGEADTRGGQDADQHRRAHAPRQQHGDQQQAEDGQRGALVAQVAERHRGGGVGYDDPRVAEAEQGDEQPHARRHRRVQLIGNGGDDELPHAHGGEQQEGHPGNEDGPQRRLPRDPHPLHHRVREVGVEPHTGRQRDGVSGKASHEAAPHGRRDARGRRHRRQRHAGLMQDGGVDEDDVRHRHEGGEPGQNFGLPGGAEFLELEVVLQTMTQGHGLTL